MARLRAVSRLFPTLLLLASYVWGGCISCEQFFMLPGSKSDCCDRNKCKKAPKQSKSEPRQQDCQKMPLEQVLGAHSTGVALLSASIHTGADVPVLQISEPGMDPITHSPPDLPVLNATLLI